MAKRNNRLRTPRLEVRRRLTVEHLGDRRVLAAITGEVFEDLNGSLRKDDGELAAASRLVYIDANSNEVLDTGELTAVTDSSGAFRFDNLADGNYSVRLYSGTESQTQTIPIQPQLVRFVITIDDASDVVFGDDFFVTATAGSVVTAYPDQLGVHSVSVGQELRSLQAMPDGRILLVGSDTTNTTSWIFDPVTRMATPVSLQDTSGATVTSPTGWGSLLLNDQGLGVILPQIANPATASPYAVRSIDASDPTSGIEVTTTSTIVPADTKVLSSATGVRTVFASEGATGLELSLWSNSAATLITTTPIEVPSTTEMLSFDDDAGILALRTSGGGFSIHDVDAGFATLYSFDSGTAVMIDAERDLLFTYSSDDFKLRMLSLTDATVLFEMPVSLTTIGDVTKLVRGDSPNAIVAVGTAGVQQVRLDVASGNQVTITGGVDADPILFGIKPHGTNSAPSYNPIPSFTATEDQTLTLAAPAALAGATDPDGDSFIVLQMDQAANGTATIQIDGSLSYVPNPDFSGTDTVTVTLSDGRTASAPISLTFNVQAVPDEPTGIEIDIDPVPENLPAGTPIGGINVIDVDGGGGHVISIDDPRFGVDGGDIIFIGGDINFEAEPLIPLVVSATDSETGTTVTESVSVRITDANDPITGITPTEAFVLENAPGDVVTELKVLDEDEEQFHTFTVDDERFIVENFDLRLADGVSVDYETEQVIVVNVTATEVGTGGTFTQAITITVRDLVEQPVGIALTKDSVVELTEGDEVGDVLVDGAAPDPRLDVTVDDSRFEIVGSTLKLKEDVFVERAIQTEIQVTISVSDPNGELATVEQDFVIQVLPNETPLHNLNDPYDVNHDGSVSASDALAIINYLNIYGPGPVGSGGMEYCYDVNADGFITALDALLVLNRLSQTSSGTVGGEGDGEQSPAPAQTPRPEGEQLATDLASDSQDTATRFDLSSPSKTRDALFVQWQQRDERPDDFADFANEATSATDQVDESLRLLSDETA
ncbi:Ig-like domain-containing protein [Rubripirellula reticaptiva]|uniref:Dockerin type I repeat protein n=1 Tax=Rubripirellula reticaptiva TaxID=2528013 RepID=A0A5C6EHH0_9BACT|nr:Ig-like domain-containing protein [Rubripirellula reticaptiva]TWU48462.1 Dockerin type I repeat protein [Rubripirellula reticaptiva]